MTDYNKLKIKALDLAEREWDDEGIGARIQEFTVSGIPRKQLKRDEIKASKTEILERVQVRAEEYNYYMKNCAKGTALALLEEFGLGNMDIIKALSPFPGFGGTGWMCGGVTGALIAFGLFFGNDDVQDLAAVGTTMKAAREFISQFTEELGSVLCPDIQDKAIFGRYMDAGASMESMEAFAKADGFEKCSLPPGIGAKLAAEIIIDSME